MKASTIQKNLAALLTGVSLLTLSACASAPMGTTSIKSAMQQMKNTHQAAMNSDNLAVDAHVFVLFVFLLQEGDGWEVDHKGSLVEEGGCFFSISEFTLLICTHA